MSTWKMTRATNPNGRRPSLGWFRSRGGRRIELGISSAEVRQTLLASRTDLRRGELVFHHPGETSKLVHAPRPEARVVVVEEHEGALDRIGRLLEFLVPRAHLRGLVFLDLLEFRDFPVPDHPKVDLVRSHIGRRSQVLVFRPYHRDVPVTEELVDVVTEPRLVSEFDGVRVLVDLERAKELLHDDPMGVELDGWRKLRDERAALFAQFLGGCIEPT